MSDVLDKDPREDKIPVWAREQLAALRSEVRSLRARNARIEERLAEHVSAEGETNTVLVDPMGGYYEIPDRPLGNGATIRFADFYQVHYANVGSGARALVIEADAEIQVRPVNRDHIIVARA